MVLTAVVASDAVGLALPIEWGHLETAIYRWGALESMEESILEEIEVEFKTEFPRAVDFCAPGAGIILILLLYLLFPLLILILCYHD